MKILDLAKKAFNIIVPSNSNLPQSNVEKKGYSGVPFNEYLYNQGFYDLSAYASIMFYRQVSSVYTAVSIITKEVKSIKPVVVDKKTGQHIEDYPIYSLTDLPNADVTWDEFIEQIATYYTVTGNAFVIATGKPSQPAYEVYCQPPQSVTVVYGNDGFIYQYNVSTASYSMSFTRHEVNGRFRFYSQDGMREIWHIRTFNPYNQTNTGMGMSPMVPIYYELRQHMATSEHNLSLLMRGARMSVLISFKDELSDEQYTRIREEWTNYNTGPQNAGRMYISPQEAVVQEMGINNKDMDFLNLKKEATYAIYNALGVPLPLVSPDQMTYANLEEANLRLYNSAVIPTAKKIYIELNNFLMHRYPDSENLEFIFDPRDIPALEPVKSRMLKEKQSLGIYTINELRIQAGESPVDGANGIYIPSNVYPVGSTAEPKQQSVTLVQDEEQDDTKSKMRDKYSSIMRAKKDEFGKDLFSEDEIIAFMVKNELY